MKIDREHPVGPGSGDQIGNQLGGDGCSWAGFPILPGVTEIGQHGGDPLRRRAPQRVDADQELHQIVVGRIAGGLNDEDILAADILVDLDEHLLVGEAAHAGIGQRHLEIVGNRSGQRQVAVPGEQFHVAFPQRRLGFSEAKRDP